MKRAVRAIAALSIAAAVIALPGVPSVAAGSTPPGPVAVNLPLSGLSEMVMDTAHNHLFVTGYSLMSWSGYSGGADAEVLALNLDGSIAKTFTGLDGAAGMYLDAASNRLYIAEYEANELQAIRTDTLALGSSWALGTDAACPTEVVKAAGYLWSNINCGAHAGAIARTNTNTSAVTTFPANGGRHMVVQGSIVYTAGPGLQSWDDASGTPTLAAAVENAPEIEEMVVAPGATDILTASPSGVQKWTSSDLTPDGSYPLASNAIGVAVSGDGAWVATATPYDGVSIFPVASSTPVNTFPWTETGATVVAPRGIALNGDGSTLFVVTGIDWYGQGTPVLTILEDATVPRSAMTLTKPNEPVQVSADFSLSGTLTFTDSSSAANQTVHVARVGPDATVTALPDVTTGVGGTITINDVPPVVGDYTYEAWFDGTASHRYAVATASVTAEKYWPKLTVTASTKIADYPSKVKITAKLVGYDPGVTVTIYAKPHDGTKKVIASGLVAGAGGVLSVNQVPQRLTTYSATSSETASYVSMKSKSIWVNVRPQIIGAMKGGYATSSGYRLYHYTSSCPRTGTGCPTSAFLTKPNLAGDSISIHLELKINGKWKFAASYAPKVRKDGTAGVTWVYRDRSVIGLPARIRARFAGDSGHTPANSPYLYFRVTN